MNKNETADSLQTGSNEKTLPEKEKAPAPSQQEIDNVVNAILDRNSKAELKTMSTEQKENSITTDDIISSKDSGDSIDSLQTKPEEQADVTVPAVSKRSGSRRRRESLEEYRQVFLRVPKLDDRKPVFISRDVRDSLDEIVRRLGGRGMSVSGFIENLTRHHLEIYHEDIEQWRKL